MRIFWNRTKIKRLYFLELGVGFNTPIIIRFPFEKMVRENKSYSLIQLNKDEAVVPESFKERAIGIGGDMAKAITAIRGVYYDTGRKKMLPDSISSERGNPFSEAKIPKDKQGQENLLRSPDEYQIAKPIPADFLKIQDEYLIERNRERGITDIADLTPVASDPRLYIWQEISQP